MCVRACAHSYPTLCDPIDCSPSGSSVHGIFQARILEWLPLLIPGNLPDPGIKTASQHVICMSKLNKLSMLIYTINFISTIPRFSLKIYCENNNKKHSDFSSTWPPSVQFSHSVVSAPMDRSTPGLPVHHQLPELTQTHVHQDSDAIQPSHPLLPPSPLAFSLSQHQGLF